METHSPENLDDVKLAILRQHTQLLQLLDELETNADAVLAKGGDGEALRHAVDAVHVRFTHHVEYEKSHLSRWLPNDHGEQNDRMKGLVHDHGVYRDPQALAREARAFVHSLRKELAEEAATLRSLG